MEEYIYLQQRVEAYFNYAIHTFDKSKLNHKVCRRCFCNEEHPLHSSEETN
jgi:hypothetical protein